MYCDGMDHMWCNECPDTDCALSDNFVDRAKPKLKTDSHKVCEVVFWISGAVSKKAFRSRNAIHFDSVLIAKGLGFQEVGKHAFQIAKCIKGNLRSYNYVDSHDVLKCLKDIGVPVVAIFNDYEHGCFTASYMQYFRDKSIPVMRVRDLESWICKLEEMAPPGEAIINLHELSEDVSD